ncbi:MAG: alcohol dehydrogenase catalytic domain-containing protein [Microbacteriaceae bacterium]
MRVVMLHGPGDLRVENHPAPVLPAGGLVVRTAYTGVCGSDVRNRIHGSARLTGPQVPGHEMVGVIAESDDARFPAGTDVAVCPGAPCGTCADCRAGRANLCADRVVLGYDVPGGMAEAFAVPRGSLSAGCVVPLPEGLALRPAVLSEPLHTVINGQDLARVAAGDTVLVLGLGTIGTLHAAHALSLGAARVLALDPRPERVAAAASVLGTGTVAELAPDDVAHLRAQAGAAGWSVVIVAAGAVAAVELAMEVVARSGRVLAFAGLPPGDATVRIDANRIHYQQLELIGAFGGTPATYARAVAWLAASELHLGALVTHEFAIDDARAAYRNVEDGNGLKTVLRGPAAD